ncbi:MAG: ankyrin repeat domain-containing protein [Pseudomonadota bacterium]
MAGQIGKILYRANSIFWGAFVTVLMGLLVIITLPLTFLYKPLRWALAPDDDDTVDPSVLADYEKIMQVLRSGKPERLEVIAATTSGFPAGKDGFLSRPWLSNAIDSGAPESVRWMLDQGVELNYFDDEGMSPLTSAIARADDAAPTLVTMLLEGGANVNAVDRTGRTPLHEAAVHGSDEVVRLLLERGADPAAYDAETVPRQPEALALSVDRPEIAALIQGYLPKDDQPNVV